MNRIIKFAQQFRNSRRLRSQRGIAAVEFALMAPLWLTLLMGAAEVSYLAVIAERTNRISSSVSNIVTQYADPLNTATVNDIFLAAGQIMAPYNTSRDGTLGTSGIVILTSIYQSNNGPIICWQRTGGGTMTNQQSQIGSGGDSALCTQGIGNPANLGNLSLTLNTGDNIIIAEAYFTYAPIFLKNPAFYDLVFQTKNLYSIAAYLPRITKLTTPPA